MQHFIPCCGTQNTILPDLIQLLVCTRINGFILTNSYPCLSAVPVTSLDGSTELLIILLQARTYHMFYNRIRASSTTPY
jgi:hypothetical protein